MFNSSLSARQVCCK